MKAIARLEQAHVARFADLQVETSRKAEREKLKAIIAIEAARLWPIHIEVCPIDRIRRLAIDEHVERSSSCEEFHDCLAIRRDPALVAEIVRAFVIHRLTDHDAIVRRYAQTHESADSLEVLKRRVEEKIDRLYGPFDE